jgi:hypothetical protein
LAVHLESYLVRLVPNFQLTKICSGQAGLGVGYHWSIMQIEYATDIVFRDRGALAPLYEAISRTAIHTVKPEHVATFLGRRLTQNFSAELGNDFNTRIRGTRIRHSMGPASIKMYDKFGRVLRIERLARRASTRSANPSRTEAEPTRASTFSAKTTAICCSHWYAAST